MKKLLIASGLILFSLSGFSQTGGFVGTSPTTDTTPNPSGVGFGGAMGGASSPAGSSSLPHLMTPGSGSLEQQRQEDMYRGPSIPSTSPAPSSNLPVGSGSTTTPTAVPRSKNVPAATGVGTGAPTTY